MTKAQEEMLAERFWGFYARHRHWSRLCPKPQKGSKCSCCPSSGQRELVAHDVNRVWSWGWAARWGVPCSSCGLPVEKSGDTPRQDNQKRSKRRKGANSCEVEKAGVLYPELVWCVCPFPDHSGAAIRTGAYLGLLRAEEGHRLAVGP